MEGALTQAPRRRNAPSAGFAATSPLRCRYGGGSQLLGLGMSLVLAACAGGIDTMRDGGIATYDAIKAATEACAAKGGQLRLKRNGDPQYLDDYACERK